MRMVRHLGVTTNYSDTYNPDLLEAIPRDQKPSIYGEDVWNAYEFSTLNTNGKPIQAQLQVKVPYTSPNIFESKSFKLYLNSFNNFKVSSLLDAITTIKEDLSKCIQCEVSISVVNNEALHEPEGIKLDDLDIVTSTYNPDPSLLKVEKGIVSETLYSHLFRSNCPVTNQPDWATVSLSYSGPKIANESLLAYLVSYRNHNGFHESCVDMIIHDVMTVCKCTDITVSAGFLRRGGIDISPYRTTKKNYALNFLRSFRQ